MEYLVEDGQRIERTIHHPDYIRLVGCTDTGTCT